MVNRMPRRRRQRHVRIAVAAALLGLATAVALPALALQSPLWLSAALIVSLVCGVTSMRITYVEVLQSRRESAASSARQASDYRTLSVQRSEENGRFSALMANRVEDRDRSIQELEGTIRLVEKRATVAETKAKFEAGRAAEATQRLSELQEELTAAEATHAAETRDLPEQAWDDQDLDTVVDLMNWEERTIAQTTAEGSHRKHA